METTGVYPVRLGWFVGEQAQLDYIYKDTSVRNETEDLVTEVDVVSNPDFWRVCVPFMMDLQAAKLADKIAIDPDFLGKERRNNVDPVVELYLSMLEELKSSGLISRGAPSVSEYRDNNIIARQSARGVGLWSTSVSCSGDNRQSLPTVRTVDAVDYVLPPRCRYLCDDVTRAVNDASVVEQLVSPGKFDCIVMDPPWTNKFVRRKRKLGAGYQFLEVEDLVRLPVGDLASDGCLVAVWCTNKQAHIDAVEQRLFPVWRLHKVATWFWVKVTVYGETVTARNRQEKLPYERIIFGRVNCGEHFKSELANPEDGRLLVSVPCAVHSRKPFLNELLRPYVCPVYRGLEVFARSLLPGWTSWGNQPLLLQRLGAVMNIRIEHDTVSKADYRDCSS